MSDETDAPATPFWRFSLHFYRHAGVSDACIALQDSLGIDVNLLLFLFWLAAGRQLLSAAEVKRLDDRVRSWRELTIVPIRDARRKLKGAATLVDPNKQEAFRNKVKAVELDAERLQQEALYAFTQSGPVGSQSAPPAAARANIAAYAGAVGKTFPQPALDTLFAAFDGIEHAAYAGR
jgi:uncharacterized protein (TIGR02444 family)